MKDDHHTVQQILDGTLSQKEFVKFQGRMRRDPELMRLYGGYAILQHSLYEEFEDQPIRVFPSRNVTAGASKRWVVVAIAALITVFAGAWFTQRQVRESRQLANRTEVSFSADAVWSVEDAATGMSRKSVLIPGSTLHLVHGQAEFSTSAGVGALFVGPGSLTLVSNQRIHLAAGRGRFVCKTEKPDLEITTPSMTAKDLGTVFGVSVMRDKPDELHVIEGKVQVRINGRKESEILTAGSAGRVNGTEKLEPIAFSPAYFPASIPGFQEVVSGPFNKENWRVEFGVPAFAEGRVDGSNYTAFLHLTEPAPNADEPVILATLSTSGTEAAKFHTDGWAGLSFYQKGVEALFFGDSFGPEKTWSLDIKQRIPIVLPANFITGPRTVTLRYDSTTGEVSLHEGKIPFGPAFCSGKIPPGMKFDEIRIGASAGADLSLNSLTLLKGGRGPG